MSQVTDLGSRCILALPDFSGQLPLWKIRAMLDMYPVAPAVYMMNKNDTEVEVKWRDKLVGEHSSLKIKREPEHGQERETTPGRQALVLSPYLVPVPVRT